MLGRAALSCLNSLSLVRPWSRKTFLPIDRSQRDLFSDRRQLHAVYARRAKGTMGMDAFGVDMVPCDDGADFENFVPHTLLVGFDSALRGHGLAGVDCHKTNLVECSLAGHTFNICRRHRLHGRLGLLRSASNALQSFHLALVCDRWNDVSLFRGALVLEEVTSDKL